MDVGAEEKFCNRKICTSHEDMSQPERAELRRAVLGGGELYVVILYLGDNYNLFGH